MISITSETIDICKVLLDTMDNSAGGTVLFIGSVRDHNKDGTVSEIYYEAYKEMAEKNLTEIEIEARKNGMALDRIGVLAGIIFNVIQWMANIHGTYEV